MKLKEFENLRRYSSDKKLSVKGIDMLVGKIKFLLSEYGENETCKIPTPIVRMVMNYLVGNGKGESVVEYDIIKNGKENRFAIFNIDNKLIMAKMNKKFTELSIGTDIAFPELPEKSMKLDDLYIGTNHSDKVEKYTLTDFIKDTNHINRYERYSFPGIRPLVVCKDGFTLSIQASAFNLCTPRKNNIVNYDTFELSKISETIPELEEYDETIYTRKKLCLNRNRTYGYVPKALVEKILEEHGGIDKEKTLSKTELDIWMRNNQNLLDLSEYLDDMGEKADTLKGSDKDIDIDRDDEEYVL